MLIDIGACGLHTINGSLQIAGKATDWNLKKLFSSMYQIFHESPSRASDYERMAEATRSDFLHMFCATWWAENQSVGRNAREVCSKVVIVVEYWKSLPKSKEPGRGKPGQNTSFEHLCVNKRSFGSLEIEVFRRHQWESKCISWYVTFRPDACNYDLTSVDYN